MLKFFFSAANIFGVIAFNGNGKNSFSYKFFPGAFPASQRYRASKGENTVAYAYASAGTFSNGAASYTY